MTFQKTFCVAMRSLLRLLIPREDGVVKMEVTSAVVPLILLEKSKIG